MKKFTKPLSYFFFLLMLGFVACNSSTTVEPSTSIIGKWKVNTINNKGASADGIAIFRNIYMSSVWEFKSDKTLAVANSDFGTYTVTGSILSVNSKATGTFTISGATMTWLDNDDKIEFVFTRQ